MPNTGSGIGTAIPVTPPVPDGTLLFDEFVSCGNLALPLAYYPKLVGYDECAFWGVMTDENQNTSDCSELWTETQRSQLCYALSQAQQMLEDFVGYFFMPMFVSGTVNDSFLYEERFTDQRAYNGTRLLTRWMNLLEFGKRTEAWIVEDTPVSYGVDPVVLGPFITTIRDTYEVKVYHPDSNREITPSKIVYSNGQLLVYIPKCRLVKEAFFAIGTTEAGISYEQDAFFEDSVDIKRVYADNSQQVNLVAPHACDPFCASTLCAEQTDPGCAYIINPKLGIISAGSASYNSSSGIWSRSTNFEICACNYEHIRLYYRCGLKYLPPHIYDLIIRLAHTLMPDEPCDCARIENQWRSDREIPRQLVRMKMACPFGEMNGAWFAWRACQRLKIYRATVLP